MADGRLSVVGHPAPVLHLPWQSDDGVFATYVNSFDRVWDEAASLNQ